MPRTDATNGTGLQHQPLRGTSAVLDMYPSWSNSGNAPGITRQCRHQGSCIPRECDDLEPMLHQPSATSYCCFSAEIVELVINLLTLSKPAKESESMSLRLSNQSGCKLNVAFQPTAKGMASHFLSGPHAKPRQLSWFTVILLSTGASLQKLFMNRRPMPNPHTHSTTISTIDIPS